MTERGMNITLHKPEVDRPPVHEMLIVHRILRRGFAELAALVGRTADGATSRAQPIAEHADFLLDALHNHHSSEDEVLWPKLLQRAKPHAELVQRMEAQHEAVAEHIERATKLLAEWRQSASRKTADELTGTLTALTDALVVHLDEEESEILPLVSEHITSAEWAELAQRSFEKFPRSALPIMHGTMLEVTSAEEAAEFAAGLPAIVHVMWRLFGRRKYARYIRRVRGEWSPLGKSLGRRANHLGNRLYRRGIGRTAKAKLPVMLVTVPGRKTGTPHTVPVAYFEHDGSYLVAASAGGSKPQPQWFRNVRVADRVQLQLGDDVFDALPRVPDRAERDRLWHDVVLAQAPFFAQYEQKSGRVISVVLLTRV